MKHLILICLAVFAAPAALAVEILRWERLPLTVALVVGQERVVFIDRNVRVGVPANVGDRLRVQSAGGAIYLRANEPIGPTRLQLQDADNGALILLDIMAGPANDGDAALEPVRIVESDSASRRDASQTLPGKNIASGDTPLPVVLTRHAAQSLYAPLRTVEPVPGITRVNLRRDLPLDTLLPTLPVRADALAAWRLAEHWVTAVKLTNTGNEWLTLDPRTLQGDFLTATFQHNTLGAHGTPEDSTVLYLVTRHHGLSPSLLPAIQRFAPAAHLPKPDRNSQIKENSHAQ